jgi:hypothetical protein
MSAMAVVRVAGVGTAYDAAKIFPTTWLEVANWPDGSRVSENPVRPPAATGLAPMGPSGGNSETRCQGINKQDILMTDGGTVETPLLARIAKLPAVRRLTGAGPKATTLLRAACAETRPVRKQCARSASKYQEGEAEDAGEHDDLRELRGLVLGERIG